VITSNFFPSGEITADIYGVPPFVEIVGNVFSNCSLAVMISVPEPSEFMICSALSATISNLGNPPSGVGIGVLVGVGDGLDVADGTSVGVGTINAAVDARRVCADLEAVRTRTRIIGSSIFVFSPDLDSLGA